MVNRIYGDNICQPKLHAWNRKWIWYLKLYNKDNESQ